MNLTESGNFLSIFVCLLGYRDQVGGWVCGGTRVTPALCVSTKRQSVVHHFFLWSDSVLFYDHRAQSLIGNGFGPERSLQVQVFK